MLRKLIREEIDPNPRSASCSSRGCCSAATSSSSRAATAAATSSTSRSAPGMRRRAASSPTRRSWATRPRTRRFGRPPEGTDFLTGQPVPPNVEVACVNPASIGANAESPAQPLVPSEPFAPGLLSLAILQLYGGFPPTAATTWVAAAGPLHRPLRACQRRPRPRDPPGRRRPPPERGARPDLGPSHRRRQRGARQPPGRRRGADRGLPAPAEAAVEAEGEAPGARPGSRVVGADRKSVRKVVFRLRGAKLATDASAPFSVRVGRAERSEPTASRSRRRRSSTTAAERSSARPSAPARPPARTESTLPLSGRLTGLGSPRRGR